MELLNINLTNKQAIAMQILMDKEHTEVLYGGSAGSGKTFLGSKWITTMALNYPNTRWMVARDDLTTLKRTSLVTLISKVFPLFDLKADVGYHYNQQAGVITFSNGSEIILGYLKYEPSDPEFDRLGSLEITGAWIDEGSEVSEKGYEVLKTRIRHNLDRYGLIPKILITTNPCNNFIKIDFVLPYQRGEDMGRKIFVPALMVDNEFLESSYEAVLENIKDPNLRKRLKDGDWNYNDAPDNLISNSLFEKGIVNKFPNIDRGRKRLGVDIAREGNDKTVMALIVDNILIDLREVVIDKNRMDISGQVADHVIAYCEDLEIGYGDVAIDGVGVGAGVLDNLHSKGFYCKQFKGAYDPVDGENYGNARAEAYWKVREDLTNGGLHIFAQLPNLEILAQEITNIKYFTDDKKIRVEKKEIIKKRIGKSPDYSDAVKIANYVDMIESENAYLHTPYSDMPIFIAG